MSRPQPDPSSGPVPSGRDPRAVSAGDALANPYAHLADPRWAPDGPAPDAGEATASGEEPPETWGQGNPPPGSHWSTPTPGAGAALAGPPRRPLPWKLLAGVLIVVVALAGVLLLAMSQFRPASAPPTTAATQELGRPAPPGWSRSFAWSTDIPAITGALAVGENRVAYVDDRGALRVLNADTGSPVFSSVANTVSGNAKPFIAIAQGTPVTGIVDGANLMLWPLNASEGAEPRQITLAMNARLFQQGGGLMVSTGKEHWVVTSAFTLIPVNLPTDHVALGVTPDGNLLSAPTRGSWTINPANAGAAPRVVRPAGSPPGTEGEMYVAWASRGVIAAWGNTNDQARRTVGLYEANTGRLLASTTLSTEVVQNGLPLTVSPRAEHASAGPMLAHLADGSVTVVDRWSTIMSDAKNLYGTRDGVKMAWDGGEPIELDAKTVVPWGTSDQGHAVVLDPIDGDRVRLGALRAA